MNEIQKLGLIIAKIRKSREMTQQDLANQIPNVSRTLVAAWESGRSTPNHQQIRALAKVFQINPGNLQSEELLLPQNIDLTKVVSELVDKGGAFYQELSETLFHGAFTPLIRDIQEANWSTSNDSHTGYVFPWQSALDLYAHRRLNEIIQDRIVPFFPNGLIVISEEALDEQGRLKPYVLPYDADASEVLTYVIIDPVDRTPEAEVAITGFASVTVGTFVHGPLVSVVFVLFDRYVSCYYTITGQGARVKFHDGSEEPLTHSMVKDLENARLAAYNGKSGRLCTMASFSSLTKRHGEESPFIDASGCHGFCLVASSRVDAFIEVAKGYAWHDIVSGAHILQEAGGIVKDLDFRDLADPLLNLHLATGISDSPPDLLQQVVDALSLPLPVKHEHNAGERHLSRFKFIAAGMSDLGTQIAVELARES